MSCIHARYAVCVIPTLLLTGLLSGRWWRVSIPAATIGWPALLLATGVISGLAEAAGVAALGFINMAVGVLVFQAVRGALGGISSNLRQASNQ